MSGIIKRDYYFECRCNRKFHIRKRRYINDFYCPICNSLTRPMNVIRKITKEQIKAIRELIKSNKQIVEGLTNERIL